MLEFRSSGYHHVHLRAMSEPRIPSDHKCPQPESGPVYRPSERFWPFVDLSEEPSAEELAALDPDLHEVLFGPTERPFSVTLSFRRFDGDDYQRAVELARAAAEYREVGTGAALRHRARYFPEDASKLRDLFEVVGSYDECDVLIDDRPVPYARELWLPLVWFLIYR